MPDDTGDRAGRKARARKRHSPEGWTGPPVWSDDDVARHRAWLEANTSPTTGAVRMKDRRKPWQKRMPSCTYHPFNGTVRWKR